MASSTLKDLLRLIVFSACSLRLKSVSSARTLLYRLQVVLLAMDYGKCLYYMDNLTAMD
jgi:hypothetical protein